MDVYDSYTGDGTNVHLYSNFKGTDNQRFYIFRLFDSYYLKPVHSDKMVDMSFGSGNIEIWGYGNNWYPQMFSIVKQDYQGASPANLGQEFYALIKNKKSGYVLSKDEYCTNNTYDVKTHPQDESQEKVWHFIRLGDGSYAIRNAEKN